MVVSSYKVQRAYLEVHSSLCISVYLLILVLTWHQLADRGKFLQSTICISAGPFLLSFEIGSDMVSRGSGQQGEAPFQPDHGALKPTRKG